MSELKRYYVEDHHILDAIPNRLFCGTAMREVCDAAEPFVKEKLFICGYEGEYKRLAATLATLAELKGVQL